MFGVAKVGDIGHGVCKAGHPGVPKGQEVEMTTELLTGSPDVILNGMPVALMGTIGHTSCGHHTQAITGSPTVFVNGVAIHRLTDLNIVTDDGGGLAHTITASSDVFAGP